MFVLEKTLNIQPHSSCSSWTFKMWLHHCGGPVRFSHSDHSPSSNSALSASPSRDAPAWRASTNACRRLAITLETLGPSARTTRSPSRLLPPPDRQKNKRVPAVKDVALQSTFGSITPLQTYSTRHVCVEKNVSAELRTDYLRVNPRAALCSTKNAISNYIQKPFKSLCSTSP